MEKERETPKEFLRSLMHEVAHLIQSKSGSFVKKSVPSIPGYDDSDIEVDARRFGDSVQMSKYTDVFGVEHEINEKDMKK